jgi:ankyrin repeat protein
MQVVLIIDDMPLRGEYGTAICAACASERVDVVNALLQKGADVNATGGSYRSALQAAALRDHTEIVCILLEMGADVNEAGGHHGSPLQAAAA